jgi:hypothetical protein
LLRARRMLMERSTDDDGPTSRSIREGFDQFLADLTHEREALDLSQRNMPLDVCGFCVQFLPSSYNLSSDAEEEMNAPHSAGYTRATPSAPRVSPRCSSGGQLRSSLVIQHQLPSKVTAPAALGKSPRTARMAARLHRPRSCTPAAKDAPPPRQLSPTYRLLSNDATRVLRIESPAAVFHSLSMGQDSNQHRLLAAPDCMGNLRAQEQQQTATILRAETRKRESHYQQRAFTTKLAQKTARERAECMTGSVNAESPKHQNIIDALLKGAGSLYTGVLVAQQEHQPPVPVPRKSLNAGGSKVVTKKHGRHFKTELFFPAIPASAQAARKK